MTRWFLQSWLANGIANLGVAIRKAQVDRIFRAIDVYLAGSQEKSNG